MLKTQQSLPLSSQKHREIPMKQTKKTKKKTTTSAPSLQWYLLGSTILLMTLTTSLRLTLHLVEQQNQQHQQQQQHQEGIDAFVPAQLSQHYSRRSQNDAGTNNITSRRQSRENVVSSFHQRMAAHPIMTSEQDRLVRPDDIVYEFRHHQWDSAPIVLEEYKLIFFTIPKVACTTFKQLFRRMTHQENWKSQDPIQMLPHNPAFNGLTYLYNYTLEQANDLMTRHDYTRAIFVRDPKYRFLSSFLDKGLSNFGDYVRVKCCPRTRDCIDQGRTSAGFLQLIQTCSDPHWDPQMRRMEPKYWKYINFIGHFEKLNVDGPRLLQQIGAWEEYGKTGWGKYGNLTLFQRTSASGQSHTTGSKYKVWQWLTPGLERQIEDFYAADYDHPQFEFQKGINLTKDFWIKGNDKIFKKGPWDGAPVVVEKYKLLFFTMPRIGDLIWKQAFRRMQGLDDWNQTGGPKGLPHDPNHNGLVYLYDYDAGTAEQFLKDPNWTKAMFVRNPKDRFLDVFSHMSTHPKDVQRQCCPKKDGCEKQAQSLIRLLDLSLRCKSDQWALQSHRMEPKYWEYINVLGHLESAEDDAKHLLERIGAWEEIGASGWGPAGNDHIFAPTGHEYDAVTAALVSYTTVVDRLLEDMYKEDLENQRFEFPKKPTPLL